MRITPIGWFVLAVMFAWLGVMILRAPAHGAALPDHTPCKVVNYRGDGHDIEVYVKEAGAWVAPALLLVVRGEVVGVELADGATLCLAATRSV